MGILHFFCCGDDFRPKGSPRWHSHDDDDHHHNGHGHHHHQGHGPDRRNHYHHHHRHVHDLRLRVQSPRHDCPNHRGIGTPGFGLRNPDHDHHVNNNGGEDWDDVQMAGANGLGNNVGQMGNAASQCPHGKYTNFEAKPNPPRENHVHWDDLNEMTSQWHDGPSMTANHTTAQQPNCCKKDWKGVQAASDGAVVSYNITIQKHVKGGSGSGYTKVNKNDIHFEL